MEDLFSRYDPTTPEEQRGSPVCVVSYPDPCGEPAVGEVWDLPFCERHHREAELAAREELSQVVADELDALASAEEARTYRTNAVVRALDGVRAATGAVFRGLGWEREDTERYEEALAAAYPVEGREDLLDPETASYDYGRYEGDGPVEWLTDERKHLLHFLREASGVGMPRLVADLERMRERATVRLALAEEDYERRYVAPLRAAKAARERAGG